MRPVFNEGPVDEWRATWSGKDEGTIASAMEATVAREAEQRKAAEAAEQIENEKAAKKEAEMKAAELARKKAERKAGAEAMKLAPDEQGRRETDDPDDAQ